MLRSLFSWIWKALFGKELTDDETNAIIDSDPIDGDDF